MTTEKVQQAKMCPFCMEEIKAEATVCPHCQRSLVKPKSVFVAAVPLAAGAAIIWSVINYITMPPYWPAQGPAGVYSFVITSCGMNFAVCYFISLIIFAAARAIKKV